LHEIARSESVSNLYRQDPLNHARKIYGIALVLVTELVCTRIFVCQTSSHYGGGTKNGIPLSEEKNFR